MISIVIPTWNRKPTLSRTLELLFAQDHPKNDYEIVVVDNACTDDTTDMVASREPEAPCALRSVKLAANNLSRARNRGIREARGNVVLILNDDIYAEPFLVAEHAAFHAAHPEPHVGLLSRVDQLHRPDESPFERFFDPFPFSEISGQAEIGYLYFWTNNISLKRPFLLENGLFDEAFSDAGHEDIELGFRLAKRGFRLHYGERLTGHHYHPMTFPAACQQQYRRGFTYAIAEQKIPDPALRERLGIFNWRNSPRRLARGLARRALFNQFTVRLWRSFLESRKRNSRFTDGLYWKVLLFYTNQGYREARHASPSS